LGHYGVYGETTSNYYGYAVFSNGDFYCTGNSWVSGNSYVEGEKPAVVPTSQGNRPLYCLESPEVWFEDSGEGQLAGGLAHIDLDPLFLETVTIDAQHPMRVFVQLNDDCNGVYVQRQATGFEIVELRGGDSRASFTYRVMAKRKGHADARLEAAPPASTAAALTAPEK
jgi:hypothetical protein